MMAGLLVLLALSCGDDSSSGPPLCTPGVSQACTCVVGEGAQTCNADGTFDACSCVPPIGTPDGGTELDDGAMPDAGSRDGWADVAVGTLVTCAARFDGTLRCWGVGTAATPPPGLLATRVSTSGRISCAIDAEEGWLRCWGAGAADAPDYGPLRGRMIDVACAGFGCCVLIDDGTTRCFGSELPTTMLEGASHIDLAPDAPTAFGQRLCLWSDDGRVACSGAEPLLPVPEPAGGGWQWVTVFEGPTACGVRRDDGAVVCGAGGVALFDGLTFSKIDGTSEAVCGIDRSSAAIRCTRANGFTEATPVLGGFPTEGRFVQIEVSRTNACAIRDDGELSCWGEPSGLPTD